MRRGPVPAYFRIYQVLSERIAARVYRRGSQLPTDAELAKRLKAKLGAPLLLLQRTCFDVEGVAIYYSDLYVRSDRIVHKIELFRHRQQVDLARPVPRRRPATNVA
jgi:DNA-binding GntR family transcriptional regulator